MAPFVLKIILQTYETAFQFLKMEALFCYLEGHFVEELILN
ncbi:MAG: hypothetical protein RL161_1316 [Bacteroidota bacterium]|jgi:hypothetical protein